MSQVQKHKDQFILLLEAGFIAVNQQDEDAAVKLFKASSLLDPNNSLPHIGMGYLHFLKLELKKACEKFEAVLKKDPHNEMAKTFLGLALALTPNGADQAEKILAEAASKTKDASVKNLANDTISFVEKFIKKKPSPTQLRNPKH